MRRGETKSQRQQGTLGKTLSFPDKARSPGVFAISRGPTQPHSCLPMGAVAMGWGTAQEEQGWRLETGGGRDGEALLEVLRQS